MADVAPLTHAMSMRICRHRISVLLGPPNSFETRRCTENKMKIKSCALPLKRETASDLAPAIRLGVRRWSRVFRRGQSNG